MDLETFQCSQKLPQGPFDPPQWNIIKELNSNHLKLSEIELPQGPQKSLPEPLYHPKGLKKSSQEPLKTLKDPLQLPKNNLDLLYYSGTPRNTIKEP